MCPELKFTNNDQDWTISGEKIGKQSRGSQKNRHNADPYIVFNYLLSEPVQIQIKRNITGATNGHLAPTDVKNMLIPLPPLEKQTEIANHIRQLREQAKKLKWEAELELEKASREVEDILLG